MYLSPADNSAGPAWRRPHAEYTKDCFLPIFRYHDDVVSAILPDMIFIVSFLHCNFLIRVALAGPQWEKPHASSCMNQRRNGRAFRGGGLPIEVSGQVAPPTAAPERFAPYHGHPSSNDDYHPGL